VFSLNELTMPRGFGLGIEPLKVESILSAIELATTVNDTTPVIRYHEDSGILVVRGTRQQVDQASEVLQVLARDIERREAHALNENARLDQPGKKPKTEPKTEPHTPR
jgi:type II secretory pathway component GspD/PulD (secretin)